MTLLGQGSLFFWHDIAEGGNDDYEHWHSFQHMPERLHVPGFRRGRRYLNTKAHGPKWVIWYEVDAPAVLTSPPYLERLNNPTPWTLQAVSNFKNTSRTICTVAETRGHGVGELIATIRLGGAEKLKRYLADLFAELVERPGITGVHLLIGDGSASDVDNAEKHLRDQPDTFADWVILIEAYDADQLQAVLDTELSAENLTAHSAQQGIETGVYRLRHVLARTDLDD